MGEVWANALNGLKHSQMVSYGYEPAYLGEYFSLGMDIGLTNNADFNGLTTELNDYMLAVDTHTWDHSRYHVSFGRMLDDGKIDAWAKAQADLLTGILRSSSHNALSPCWYTADTTHLQYWKLFPNGFATPSLLQYQKAHGFTPDQAAAENFGAGYAALVKAIRKLAPNATIVAEFTFGAQPRMFNNPDYGPCKCSDCSPLASINYRGHASPCFRCRSKQHRLLGQLQHNPQDSAVDDGHIPQLQAPLHRWWSQRGATMRCCGAERFQRG